MQQTLRARSEPLNATKELFDTIHSGVPLTYQDVPDFDVEELIRLLGPRIVQTGGENYAIARHKEDPTDHSNRTTFFDWHCDGLYLPRPPRFALLHCLNPGSGKARTELANTNHVLSKLSRSGLRTLRKLRSHYIGHGGVYDHPILSNSGMLLASRGYVSPLVDLPFADHPSIRDINEAISELYHHLDDSAVPYEWNKGGTLIFDQYQYMHRRKSDVIDRDRKLIRMWFT
jgi:alpha-ketoglutarate-dependent taurine dioxygenase